MTTIYQPVAFTYDPRHRSCSLTVHVQPGAKSSAIVGLHGDALKIRIASPAVENQANAALVEFLNAAWALRSADINVRHGGKSRRKMIDITHADDALAARLRATIDPLRR